MIAAFLARFGLGWILGPIGKVIGIVIVAGLVVHFIRQDAISDAQVEQLQKDIKIERARVAAAQVIADAARSRADEAEARSDELEEMTNDLIRDAGDDCPIPDDIRERLRAIQ